MRCSFRKKYILVRIKCRSLNMRKSVTITDGLLRSLVTYYVTRHKHFLLYEFIFVILSYLL